MVTVNAHRKMLILSVCFLCLPCTALGMSEEQFLIDDQIVGPRIVGMPMFEEEGEEIISASKPTMSFLTSPDDIYVKSSLNDKPTLKGTVRSQHSLRKPGGSRKELHSSQGANQQSTRSHSKKNGKNRGSANDRKIHLHIHLSSSEPHSPRTPFTLFDTKSEKINKHIPEYTQSK